MSIPEDATVVCLVGKNGAGKSNLLNLVSRSAELFGYAPAPAYDLDRKLLHFNNLEICVSLDESEQSALMPSLKSDTMAWDGTITAHLVDADTPAQFIAGGLEKSDDASKLGQELRTAIASLQDRVHFLSIESDRSYPSVSGSIYTVLSLGRQQKSAPISSLRSIAYGSIENMYQNWMQYMFIRDLQHMSGQMADQRQANQTGSAYPTTPMPWSQYNDALKRVLPRLAFLVADVDAGSLQFLSAGRRVKFEHLSSGEREIAFLIGQIDRFQLQRGFLTIDEPELHLNPELIYKWIAYLRDSTRSGQVWIATHSLEAMDAALGTNCFVLTSSDTGVATSVEQLSATRLYSAVADTIGYPAFALEREAMCLIEGERAQGDERARFIRIFDAPRLRYVEVGSKREVSIRNRTLRDLASSESRPLRVAGVVDRDVSTQDDVKALESSGLLVLPVHEIENIYLHPETLEYIATRNSVSSFHALDEIRQEADRLAGFWIHQYAQARFTRRPEVSPEFKRAASNHKFVDIVADVDAFIATALNKLSPIDAAKATALEPILRDAVSEYVKMRDQDNIWKLVPGKQILQSMANRLGYTMPRLLEIEAHRIWAEESVQEPAVLEVIRVYLRAFTVAS
jgi:hypothetical protein